MTESTHQYGWQGAVERVWRPSSGRRGQPADPACAGLAIANEIVFVEAGVEEEALGRSTTVDVVLLGLMLPGRDGLTVCRALRSRGGLPIIITARSDTTDVISGLVEPTTTSPSRLSPGICRPYPKLTAPSPHPGSQRCFFLKGAV